MKLYAQGALAFCTKVPESARTLLEETTALHDFNNANGADLGFASMGSFGNEDLYLTAFCEIAEPFEPVEISILAIGRKDTRVWRRQMEKFLRLQKIEQLDEIRFRLLADLSN